MLKKRTKKNRRCILSKTEQNVKFKPKAVVKLVYINLREDLWCTLEQRGSNSRRTGVITCRRERCFLYNGETIHPMMMIAADVGTAVPPWWPPSMRTILDQTWHSVKRGITKTPKRVRKRGVSNYSPNMYGQHFAACEPAVQCIF